MKRKFTAVLIFLILLIPSVAFADDTVDVKITGQFDYSSAYEILKMTNEERVERGLSELKMNADLLDAAMQRAADIAVYYSHQRPDGSGFYTAFDGFSYSNAGENIAAGQPDAATVHNSWMNSESHRENILTKGFNTIGIGCFYQEDIGIRTWVQLFTDSTDGGYVTTGIITQTRTVTVFNSRLSVGAYNPSVSNPRTGEFYVYNRLCPGQTEEFALVNMNTGTGADFITSVLSPDCYSIKAGNDNLTVNGNDVTAGNEGSAKINFYIDEEYFGQYTFNISHNYQQTAGPSATCTEAGYTGGRCIGCGEEAEIKYIPPLGHVEEKLDAEENTCEKDGMTEGVICTRCNTYIKKPETIPATGHNYEKREQPFTCEESGYTYYVCLNCNKRYIDEDTVTDPEGHSWADGICDPNTGDLTFACTKCTAIHTATPVEYINIFITAVDPDNLSIGDEGFVMSMKERYDNLTEEERLLLDDEESLLRMIRAFEVYHMGDITFDGVIDQSDLSALLSAYAKTYSDADITGDSEVNSDDLSMLLANYGMKR